MRHLHQNQFLCYLFFLFLVQGGKLNIWIIPTNSQQDFSIALQIKAQSTNKVEQLKRQSAFLTAIFFCIFDCFCLHEKSCKYALCLSFMLPKTIDKHSLKGFMHILQYRMFRKWEGHKQPKKGRKHMKHNQLAYSQKSIYMHTEFNGRCKILQFSQQSSTRKAFLDCLLQLSIVAHQR